MDMKKRIISILLLIELIFVSVLVTSQVYAVSYKGCNYEYNNGILYVTFIDAQNQEYTAIYDKNQAGEFVLERVNNPGYFQTVNPIGLQPISKYEQITDDNKKPQATLTEQQLVDEIGIVDTTDPTQSLIQTLPTNTPTQNIKNQYAQYDVTSDGRPCVRYLWNYNNDNDYKTAYAEYTYDSGNNNWAIDPNAQSLLAVYTKGTDWNAKPVKATITDADFADLGIDASKVVSTGTTSGGSGSNQGSTNSRRSR